MQTTTIHLLASIVLCSACILGAAATGTADESRPNIVIVLFDDMGWGQPPSYRSESALRTPNFDKLAADGMRFTDAHSASGVCTPTRYGLLTGRYPWRIGQFGVLTTYSEPIIPRSRLTLASMLKQRGYRTACIGKWHLGLRWANGKREGKEAPAIGERFSGGPNALGFDDFYGFTHARNIETILEQDRVVAHVTAGENQPLMIQRAAQWLETKDSETPFFLYFPMCPPHTPIVPAKEFVGASDAKDLVGKDPLYGDWLYQGDAMLGQIIEVLERKKLRDNTLIIATSDNGAAHRAYSPLRGFKASIYEGGHRVPFVVSWPGKVKPGSTWDQTICLNDLFATFAEALAISIPADAGEDSVSFLPALLGTTNSSTREATVHQSHVGDLAIRSGVWKQVFHIDGRRELFHLAEDLSEEKNVLSGHIDVARKLENQFKGYIAKGRSTPGEPQKPDRRVQLKALAK